MTQDTAIERRQLASVASGPSATLESGKLRIEAVQLRCPHCSIEMINPRPSTLDAEIACAACGTTSEFRVWHEAWCASKRPLLATAFPDLNWCSLGRGESNTIGGLEDHRLLAI